MLMIVAITKEVTRLLSYITRTKPFEPAGAATSDLCQYSKKNYVGKPSRLRGYRGNFLITSGTLRIYLISRLGHMPEVAQRRPALSSRAGLRNFNESLICVNAPTTTRRC